MTRRCNPSAKPWLGLVTLLLVSSGCGAVLSPAQPLPITAPEPTAESDVPRELAKVSLPPYIIEPPDILLIDAVKIVPKPPHSLEPFDALGIRVDNALLDSPIAAVYVVDPQGRIDLGPAYGKVAVKGMTIDEARTAINEHLAETLTGARHIGHTCLIGRGAAADR